MECYDFIMDFNYFQYKIACKNLSLVQIIFNMWIYLNFINFITIIFFYKLNLLEFNFYNFIIIILVDFTLISILELQYYYNEYNNELRYFQIHLKLIFHIIVSLLTMYFIA